MEKDRRGKGQRIHPVQHAAVALNHHTTELFDLAIDKLLCLHLR